MQSVDTPPIIRDIFPYGITVHAVHVYGGLARERAKRLKNVTDEVALRQAAREMAALVPPHAVLVPAPSSTGLNDATFVLAQHIADCVQDAVVCPVVTRAKTVPSSMLLRQAGRKPVSVAQHTASMAVEPTQAAKFRALVQAGRPVVAVDNVVTSGSTLAAMQTVLNAENLLNLPLQAVVYADVSRNYDASRQDAESAQKNPATRPLCVCVSGSREYVNLWKIEQVLRDLPAGTIILHGGARGVDAEADRVARKLGLQVQVYPAHWQEFGRAAGHIRNREMVAECDVLLAFWDGASKGTASAIKAAREMNKDSEVILDKAGQT